MGRSARCPAWRTVWAGRLELLPKVRAWSIGPPHPTLLPVTALWPNTVFGALAQLEGGKRGLLTQHFFWSNSPTGHQIEEALFFRVSFLPPYRETRLPNGCSRYPRDCSLELPVIVDFLFLPLCPSSNIAEEEAAAHLHYLKYTLYYTL